MPAQSLLTAIEGHGCEVRATDGQLFIRGGRRLPPGLQQAVRSQRDALMQLLTVWDEATAYRLFKKALDAVGAIYSDGKPEWCHPLFDEVDAAIAAEDMPALRRLTARAVELAGREGSLEHPPRARAK